MKMNQHFTAFLRSRSFPRPALLALSLAVNGPAVRGADFYWQGGSGSWQNTNHWTPSRITPPGSGDNAFITASGAYTVTGGGYADNLVLGGPGSTPTLLLHQTGLTIGDTAYAAPGTVIVLSGSQGVYVYEGGSFSAANGLALEGEIQWESGRLAGIVNVATGGVINAYSTLNHLLAGTVNNQGTILWNADNLTGGGGDVGLLRNLPAGWMDVRQDGSWGYWFGSLAVDNAGTLIKSGGTNAVACAGTFTNSGVVRVQSGTLQLNAGLTSSGAFDVASGAALELRSGSCTLSPLASFTGAGYYGVPVGGSPVIYGAISAPDFQLQGEINGPSDFTLSGTLWDSGGYLSGTVTIAGTGVLNVSDGARLYGTVTNAGTIRWLSGDWNWWASAVENLPGALMDIRTDATLGGNFGVSTLRNAGTLRKSAGSGTNYFLSFIDLSNTGLLDVQSGTLQFVGAYHQLGGRINFGLAGPARFGKVQVAGAMSLAGTLSANFQDGYSPAYGDSFDLLSYGSVSGSFASLDLPPLAGLKLWSLTSGDTLTTLSIVKARPTLSIVPAGDGFNVSWPAEADPGHILQYATDLTPPVSWQEVTNAIQVIDNQNVVNVLPAGSSMFFLLR